MSMSSLWRCALVAASLGFTAAAQAGGYTIVDLGKGFYPSQVNEHLEIAGMASRINGGYPVVFRNARWHRLCCNGDLGSAYASGINGHGDAVGQGGDPDKAILWPRVGPPLELPLPARTKFLVAVGGVALDGTAVGTYASEHGKAVHCFRTSPTGPAQDLGLMGDGDQCEAFAINKSGWIVGEANSTRSTLDHAFLWRDGVFQDLGVLPGATFSTAKALNERGEVVGNSSLHAFRWFQGNMQALDPQNIYLISDANSINNSGVAVGYAVQATPAVALRFDANGITVLDDEVVNLQDWSLEVASSINDEGVIVGWGTRAHHGGQHAFMLVPQP